MQDLLTIATCEMKEEDMVAQCLFWNSLNEVMQSNGFEKADFRGFMADEAQANWNALREVFNNGKANKMEGRERSCQFHWAQSLNTHTTSYVLKNSQREHINLCEVWRTSETMEDALAQSRHI